MTSAAIYARYSSNNQRDASIEDQLRVCREYCEKHELSVVCEYCDHALSGRTDQRPRFLDMIRDAEKHLFSVLVLYSMDRLSRDKYDMAFYKHRLKKANVNIVYVTQPLGEGPEALLLESLLEGLAAYYSQNLARNVRRGLMGNALKGIVTTGHAPLGYRLTEDRHLEVDPETAPVVREIFSRYSSGESMASITRSLNERGLATAFRRPFNRNSLSVILRNEVYIGVFHWADIRVENSVPPIIKPGLFNGVQRMIEKNKTSKARSKAKQEYILSGKLVCASCGQLMVGECGRSRNGDTHYYYTCTGRKRGNGCTTRPLKKEETERLIADACRAALTDDSIREISEAAAAYAEKQRKKADPVPALKKRLTDARARLNNLLKALETGLVSETVTARVAQLEKEIAYLETEIAREQIKRPPVTAAHFAAWLTLLRNTAEKENMPADGGNVPNDNGNMLTDSGNVLTDDNNVPFENEWRSALGGDAQLINALLNRAIVKDTETEKEIALVLNLKTNATFTLTGSDFVKLVDITKQNPNKYVIYGDFFLTLLRIPLRKKKRT